MTTAAKGPAHPDSEPNFERPGRGVISEENWPEFQAKGVVFLENQDDVRNETAISRIKAAENFFGRENVFTGDAYDREEDRPLAHKPGLGIYVGPEGDLELAHRFSEMWRKREQGDTHSSDTGPASS